MKKVLAILIALPMLVTLFACHNKPTESPTPSLPANTDPSAVATAEAPVSEAPRSAIQLGFFDPSIDYDSAERYKIAYIYTGASIVYDMLDAAFKVWAEQMNVAYNSYSAANPDHFLATVQTCCEQGYDGLVLDPDPAVYPAVAELANNNSIPWMSGMAPAYDEDMKLLHPAVGYDDYTIGYDMFKWCIDDVKAKWPEATPENTGGLFIGYADLQLPERRHSGSYEAWIDNGFKEGNFFFLDGADGDMTAQTGQNLAASAMAANPKLKYWIGCGFFDDYSVGIARAAAAAGLAETTACSAAGGSALISQWEAGETSSLNAAVCIEPRLYGEPIFCGLYALITGKVTAEMLWPQWRDKSSGQTYADLRLPAVTITRDNYKDYLAFVDQYTEIDQYPYPETDQTFPVIMAPPAAQPINTVE